MRCVRGTERTARPDLAVAALGRACTATSGRSTELDVGYRLIVAGRDRPGYPDQPMLRLVLPKGSLEKATLQLFEDADLAVVRSSDVDYRAAIDDPRVIDVTILRPQEIPRYVADGLFDLGITGRDWIEETGADVVTHHPAALFEGDRPPVPDRARGRRRFEVGVGEGSPGRRARADRVPRADAPLPREARRRRRHLAVVRRDRGQDPRDRRRGGRRHRERPRVALPRA